ncbi:MAG: hypothetical protein AAF530_15225 [Pseudomonadota bacterium]
MSAMLEGLTKQLNDLAAQVEKLEAEQDAQAKTRSDLKQRMSEARQAIDSGASDKEAQKDRLHKLEIEDQQVAEAQRKTNHDLDGLNERLIAVEREIAMMEDSSIV